MGRKITANLIGVRVSWRVSDFLSDVDTVTNAIKAAGLNHELLPKNTLKKAVNRASKAIAKADNGRFVENLPTRKITDNADKAVYAIVKESVDVDTEHAEYEQETTIKLDKTKKSVSAAGTHASAFMKSYNTFAESVTDEDIRRFCRNVVIASFGIAFNPHGHDYFIPDEYAQNMDKLDTFLKSLNVGKMYITPSIDDPRSLEATWERAAEEIIDSVNFIMNNVASFEKRAKCLHDKTDKLATLKEMVAVYGKITERAALAEDVLNQINSAMDTVAKKIEEIDASR